MTLETTTLVFTDLVGSTELANRIGPGPADALRREHFELLGDATVTARGRQVKNLGDGLMLSFPSVTGALDAAVAMQRAIEARNRTADVRFQVRIGVSMGEVTAEDGDYFGEPVVQAARLCALAEGGQILVTEMVRLMAGSTSAHQLNPMGALELKGLPDPVLSHEVVWAPTTGAALSLPMRLRGAPDSAYVGRADERAVLERAWARTAGGQASLVLLSGEPGIGKTRLSSQHAFEVHAAGGTVLYGAVDEGLGVPYQPWIEAFSHYVEHAPDGLLHRYVAEAGADLVRLVPLLERRVPDLPPLSRSDGETERYVLLDAATRLLRIASAANPVLVVLDDLHWADKQTLLLLTHLHRELADSRVEFLVTFRDSDLTPDHQLTDTLASLRRADRVERISLTGLDHDEIEDLLEVASGQATSEASSELAAVLARDTNGNPLFVGEVLRGLLEDGSVAQDEHGVWGLTRSIDELSAPASVRDVVAQRVQRLGPDAAQVLATASVIGRDFDLDLLAAVLDRTEDDLLVVVETAMAASLITEAGTRAGSFRFIHALIAQALVDDQSATRRTQLHRRIAGAIQELHGPDLGERIASVARHVLASGADPAKALDWARRAGQQALSALAPDEALRWYTTALELVGRDAELHCDLATDIGEAMRAAGQPGYHEQLIAAAQEAAALGDADRIAAAVLATNRSIAASLSSDPELLAVMAVALELNPEPDERRARLLAQFGAEQMLVTSLEVRRPLADEALAIARGIDDATLASVMTSTLSAIWTASMLAERQAQVAEVQALLPRVPDPQVRAYAAMQAMWVSLEACDRHGFDAAMVEVRRTAGPTTQPTLRWLRSMAECLEASIDGDLELAEQIATAGLELSSDAGIRDGSIAYYAAIMSLRSQQGRLGEWVDLLEEVARDSVLSGLRAAYVLALTQGGRIDDASSALQELLRTDETVWFEHNAWASCLNSMAFGANRIGDVAASQAIYGQLVRGAGSLVLTGIGASSHASTALGMLASTTGDRAAAIEHFGAAEDALAALRAPVLQAQNRYEHGRALLELRDLGDRDDARTLLEQARDAFAAHDCPVRIAQCEELLATLV